MSDTGERGATRGYSAAVHLIIFALIVAVPLLLLVGVLLYRSVTLESEQIKQRIGQVLGALIDDVDRDMDRRLAILETLSTSPLLLAEDWPAFYEQARTSLRGKAYLVLIYGAGRQLIKHTCRMADASGDRRPCDTPEDPPDAPPRCLRSLHQPGGEAARLQRFTSGYARRRGALCHEPRPHAGGSSRPAAEPGPAGALVGDNLGRQRGHHGPHARPCAPAGYGRPAAPYRAAAGPPGPHHAPGRRGGADRRRSRAVVHLGHCRAFPLLLVDAQRWISAVLGATILLVGVWSSACLPVRPASPGPLAAATAAAGALGRGEPFVIRDRASARSTRQRRAGAPGAT